MNYVDKTKYDGAHCYGVINEHLPSWRKAIAEVEGFGAERAAAICSGGEIGFFALLPHVSKELVMIDYSYGSLWFAVGKYKLIEKLGSRAAHKELSTEIDLSDEYKEAVSKYNKWYYGGQRSGPAPMYPPAELARPDLYEVFDSASKGVPNTLGKSYWPPRGLDRIWADITQAEVAEFRRRRTKVTFLHADLSELENQGPFDFVYFSNALQFRPEPKPKDESRPVSYYNKVVTTQYNMDKIVKPGGLVLYCYQMRKTAPWAKCVETWETVSRVTPDRDRNYAMGWTYEIVRAPA